MTAASLQTNHRREGAHRAGPRRAAFLTALAGVAALFAQSALAQSARLEKIELQPQAGNQLQVKLVLDGPAPQPVTFTIDNPARIAVDLPDTALALDSRRVDVKSGGVDTIVAAEASGRTRLVFNLDQMMPYETLVSGNTVLVNVGYGQAAPVSRSAAATSTTTTAAAGSATVDKVDFRRGAVGAGRILVSLSDPRVQASLRQEGGRVVVDFPRATAAPQLVQRYDVVDFATPVNSFDLNNAPAQADCYDPWQHRWIPTTIDAGSVTFPDFERSIIVRIASTDAALLSPTPRPTVGMDRAP